MNFEQKNKSFSQNIESTKLFAVFNQLNAIPFTYAFEKQLINNKYKFLKYSPLNCGKALLNGEVDLGVIPATTYAKTKETWKIIPHISLSSKGTYKSVKLFFKSGLQDLHRIAIDERADSEAVLLKILMPEKFNITPEYITMKPQLEKMLQKTDAALLIGEEALHEQELNKSSFDLGEEWFDLTGLPMVFAFWAGRQMTVDIEDVKNIFNAFNLGYNNLEFVAKEFAKNSDFSWAFYHDYLIQNVNYKFTEDEHAGLKEFYNYAFYYGLIEYIPDIKFFEIR
jgi:chorismate dehydratase